MKPLDAFRPMLERRTSGPCGAQSPAPGPLGMHYYCTRERGHGGEHVARDLDDEIVGRWGGVRPASLEEALASERRR